MKKKKKSERERERERERLFFAFYIQENYIQNAIDNKNLRNNIFTTFLQQILSGMLLLVVIIGLKK